MKKTACYIHIPFCDHKCIYCDFYSIITSDNIQPFLKSVKKEINYYSNIYSEGRELISIYFGGGTPSLMEPDYIREIIDTIKEKFNVAENSEITLETNPGTVSLEKLKKFREAGINRISIGIQSFDDKELKFLTRIHNSETAIVTVDDALLAGFENISLDLIFNLPNQTKEKWKENLKQAIELPIKHISAYSLILEMGTILNKMVLDGKVKIQDEDYDAELYSTTIDFLISNGFHQYEVSNFAKPGFECVHNNAYWHYMDYFGFGTSAHSFINNKRSWNFSSLKMYIENIERLGIAVAGSETISPEKALNEFVMLELRSSGLNIKEFGNLFGDSWLKEKYPYFELLKKNDFVQISNGLIKLTKKGYAICDEILKELL
ncbi:MAG: radical SAM family heme chaperone HemW [Ignavibacteriaceae bacterium]|jgi:oxygen-independent coproporphyrinogen-3 oxidase|nr:radical SAM family heme chaperone HemW [Ignavibacteriaceae bacterium]MCW8811895.1 radical SAM family heme chaperone HemW [Chlorobium sp.]MCW8816895.1 radical SAM family heme chaperone HemW [Ignavibacteriaceae bacterium]MCW8823374.1 radical SAM family heme chaperone HemW [Ignavibacteriaceae bacterium]MCW8994283.1 radical SAM family heme chaperone HemW [Psychromonas sp.]